MIKQTQDEMVFFTGGIQSPPDYRDIPLSALASASILPNKFMIDISKHPVWHQRKIGSCVGQTGAKNKQHLDFIETGEMIQLSPRFLYAIAKARDGYAGEGTFLRLVAKIMKDIGCATQATVVDDSTLTHEQYVYNRKESSIPKAAFIEAAQYKIGGYAFADVKNVNSLKDAIVNHGGAMLLMRLGNEWFTSTKGRMSWKAKDILPLRAPMSIISGHAVWLYGYEDVVEKGVARTKFHIFNSWSDAWGDKGTGWFYYDQQAPFLNEAITLVDIPNNIKEQVKTLPTKETFRYTFNRTLTRGSSGAAVIALQTALMIDGSFNRDLYAELLANGELGWFGPVTADAIQVYQTKYALASLKEINEIRYIHGGIAGPKTRAHLNSWTS